MAERPDRCHGQRGADPVQGVLERVDDARRVVFDVDRNADQRVVARHGLLHDALLFGRYADTPAPDLGKFAVDGCTRRDGILIVRVELLLDGTQVELERLVASPEFGLDELRRDVVTQPFGRSAAGAGHAGRKVELLGIAEQIAVRPCGADAATQVGGIGRGKPNRMAQAFVRIEGERNPAESVELVCGLDALFRSCSDCTARRYGPGAESGRCSR